MTEERNRPELDGEVDSLVTRTYKEAATELAPGHLDKAVLKQAANAARPRYLKSISWTRPTAWAVTIALCVGLVLEITNAPVPVSLEIASPPERLESPASTLGKSELAPAKTNATQTVMEEERNVPVERKRNAKMSMDLRQQDAVVPSSAEIFSMKDDDMLGRAKEIATLRNDDSNESDQVLGAADSPAPALPACSEAEIATAESWLLCIERLEDAGRTVEANAQRALYEAAFPPDEPF